MILPLFQERARTWFKTAEETESFLQSLFTPVKKSIRVNTHKLSVEDFRTIAQKNNWHLTPVPWEKTGFFIEREDMSVPLGKTLEHLLGLFYIQEASSMLPAAVLQPTEKDIVLDMAAAPGSKTTQMSNMMSNQGIVLANDFSGSRLKALATNVERQGTLNVAVSNINGKIIADIVPNFFDKILLDAPCSGEGTCYKDADFFKHWSLHTVQKNAGLQKSLIASAFEALRPNGVMVYSTCTYGPEENEEVVDFLLSRFPGNAELVNCEVRSTNAESNQRSAISDQQGEAESQKLEARGGRSKNEGIRAENEGEGTHLEIPSREGWSALADRGVGLEGTVRLFPHQTHSGGFFVAKISKKMDTEGRKEMRDFLSEERMLRDKEKKQYTVFLRKTYGIDEAFFDSFLLSRIDDAIYLKPEKYLVVSKYIKLDRCGLKLLTINRGNDVLKLTALGAWAIGDRARENMIVLDEEQIRTWFQGRDVTLSDSQVKGLTTEYVILREARGFSLGAGLVQRPFKLKNQLPRHFLNV